MRTGVLYTTGEPTAFDIPAGHYELYATRGMEGSLSHKTVSLSAANPTPVCFQLSRQVDTTGFIAADTHIRTL